MSGTNHSTDGWSQATPSGEPLTLRIAAFAVAVGFGALGIGWVDANLWGSMRELESRFADVRTERFYHGVRIRHDLEALNATLLQYQLGGEDQMLDRFMERAASLRERMTRLRPEMISPEQQTVLGDLQRAFDEYLAQTVDMQVRSGLFGPSRRKVDQIHETLGTLAHPILDLCETLIQLQRAEFANFLATSQSMLNQFQFLITLSLGLLVALSVLIVVLVFRGMLRPLRLRLSQSEAAMVRHEKLAALGTLAAGVAHEIRNPLTAIKFRLFSLRKSLPSRQPAHEDADVIDQEIGRLERIVKDFIQFARPSEPQWIEVPAFRLFEEIQALMAPALEAGSIRLNIHVPRELWLRVDPQQFKQVLINLIQNAVESMDPNGSITLSAASIARAGAKPPAALISVTDTGKGIAPEARKRLFDPFFTTKEGGTGLGLAIAARIIDTLGGELTYTTELNRGTTFRILLPTHPPQDT